MTMTNTREYIQNTNNEVLRAILTASETLIGKQTAAVVNYLNSLENARPLNQDGIDAIELGLIFDLVKAVTTYTKIDDKLIEAQVSVSRKGNLEVTAEVSRDGQSYSFYTEAIIADGMVNRRHLRYITKTSLPKQSGVSDEAKAIKTKIAKLNKIQKQELYISNLRGYKAVHADRATKALAMTREQAIEAINATDSPMLEDNFDTDIEWFTANHGTRANYLVFLNEANEDKLERFFTSAKHDLKIVARYDTNIAKELKKLAGMKA